LEKELGVPLFHREGRQIRLNTYGEAFLEEVEKALQALEEGRRKIADMAGLEKGIIFLDTTFIPHFPDLLNMFLKDHPHVQFRISQAPSLEIKEELLRSSRIDFCISCHPVQQKGMCNIPVKTEDIVLVVPVTHWLADRQQADLIEAAKEPFIGFKKESSFRETTDELCRRAGFVPNLVCEADESKVVTDLVRSGLGIALLPESLVDQDETVHHVHIREPLARRTYYLTWKQDRYLSKAAAAFRDFVLRHFSDLS
jgi:DNA-binding transcriptional LysR family regulator